MAQFGVVSPTANVAVTYVQSADPVDLQLRTQKAIEAIAKLPDDQRISNITLAGGGDGHTFVALIDFAPEADFESGDAPLNPANTKVIAYMASNQAALPAARERALKATPDAGMAVFNELLEGASQGTRFMGMIICAVGQPTTAFARGHAAYSADAPNILDITVVDQFEPLPFAPNPYVDNPANLLFEQDPAGSGIMKYTGDLPISVNVIGYISAAAFALPNVHVGLAVALNGTVKPVTEATAELAFLALASSQITTLDILDLVKDDLVSLQARNRTNTADIKIFSSAIRVTAA